MLFLRFFTLLLTTVPFGNVFGEGGDEKNIVNYESIKMLVDFDETILQPLAKFCPVEEFGHKLKNIDKTRSAKWILCFPLHSLDQSFTNFANGMKREKLNNNNLKFKEEKSTKKNSLKIKFFTERFQNKEKKHELEQSKWNQLKNLYQKFIASIREVILSDMTKNYIHEYSVNILGIENVDNLDIHMEKTIEEMEMPDLKKFFILKLDALKNEKDKNKSAEIFIEIRTIALAFDERYKGNIDELEFLLQLFVANLYFCGKILDDKFQEIANKWPIWKENKVSETKH